MDYECVPTRLTWTSYTCEPFISLGICASPFKSAPWRKGTSLCMLSDRQEAFTNICRSVHILCHRGRLFRLMTGQRQLNLPESKKLGRFRDYPGIIWDITFHPSEVEARHPVLSAIWHALDRIPCFELASTTYHWSSHNFYNSIPTVRHW